MEVANSARLLALYFRCLECVTAFWSEGLDGRYREAWNQLISAENAVRLLHANAEDLGECGLYDLAEQLGAIQKLYPYRIFSSIEMLASAERCTVCGSSPWEPTCGHRVGQITEGKIAQVEVKQAQLIGLALTPRPKDKHCVMLLECHVPDYGPVRDLVAHVDETN
ncbi:MAG: hypothetical protein RLO52_20955 [Sandaracinaceae bacterium]